MIGIRADANEEIATGHIMRCITIAKQFIKQGENVCFFVADEFAVPTLKQAEMNCICLHTKWDRQEEELPVLIEELKRTGCDKLLVDSYKATKEYLAALSKICKVIYIDDMFEAVYPVHMLINYNAYHERFPYAEAYGEDTKLLLGTAYVPLREEFLGDDSDFRKRKDAVENKAVTEAEKEPAAGLKAEENFLHVLISSGGGDLHNALSGILAQAVEREGLENLIFDTIIGRFHKNENELEALADRYERVVLHRNVSNMAELMGRCEAAVSAAGTVLFELCAMQVPAVFFVCADNQNYDSDFFAREERMLFAGDIREGREDCINRICDQLEQLVKNKMLRDEMKKRLHKVTDGNGAVRIAEEIIKL